MIPIDHNSEKIQEAKDQHYKFLRYIIKKKMFGVSFNEEPPLKGMEKIRKISSPDEDVINFLNIEENLKKVLIGNPTELDQIKEQFTPDNEYLKRLLNYQYWIEKDNAAFKFYNAYSLAENLDISTCVYCNRIYTKTVVTQNNEKITRPTFDHWFPKSKFPILSLSFFNLIPSCHVCNGIKSDNLFDLNTHFHPYDRDSLENLKFRFSYNHSDYDDYYFKIETENDYSKNTVKAFKLEEIYKAHKDEIKDLIKIRKAYSENYIQMLENQILNGVNLNREEIYRLAFGVHYEESKFEQRPLSKMKKDILKELRIIV